MHVMQSERGSDCESEDPVERTSGMTSEIMYQSADMEWLGKREKTTNFWGRN